MLLKFTVFEFFVFVTDDIAVRFVEADEKGNVLWEDYGNFGPNDVHRQVQI